MHPYADPARLYFFLDYISHNAWLAWHEAPALARKHGLTLTPVPVVFGAMLSHYGQVGPAEVPAKSRWMLSNVLRKARARGIPIVPPASHPFNPLLALRVTCAAEPADQLRVVDRLFAATWAEGRAVSEPAVVREQLESLGLPADALLAAAGTDAVKQRLRETTGTAIAAGVFGVPTMLVRGELFWGYDDFPNLELFLAGRDPLPADRAELRAWLEVKPSVQRKRP
jgi:2-hydroxychromene-2-carboxylate isomerase